MKRALFFALLLLLPLAVQAQQPQLRVKYRPESNFIDLCWSLVPGATSYVVRRASTWPAWEWSQNAGNQSSFGISAQAAGSAYVYQVYATDANGQLLGTPSAGALVVTSPFAEAVSIGTPVRAAHINELRTLVNRARRAAGLADATWTFPARAAGNPVEREDVTDLRTALDAALQNIGLAPPAYTDPALTAGTIVRKVHVNELRTRVMNWPELIRPVTSVVSEAYFSPNADSVKDATRVDVSFRATTEVRWRLDVRNASNAVVRSVNGLGAAFSFTWDGRNAAGAMQPDGTYTFDVYDVNGFAVPVTQGLWSVLDTTAPAAAIASPEQSQVLSNLFANGSGTVAVTGTATDTNLTNWQLLRTGNGLGDATLGSGTSAVQSGGALATWQTIPASGAPLRNGAYTLRLTVSDRAGNHSSIDRNVTVGHFTAELAGHQINTIATPAQTVRYTSFVPFTLHEVVTVRKPDGTVVRTLFSGNRTAGTHDDVWNGRDDAGTLLGDGPYSLFAAVTANGTTFTWAETNKPVGTSRTQFAYPTCRNDAGALVDCDSSTLTFDPFINKPLRINFCVGGGDVATGCTGSNPALVVAKISSATEDFGACDANCIDSFMAGSGPHEIVWYGTNRGGSYIAGTHTRLLVLRGQTYARNMVLLTGTKPKITLAEVRPLYWLNPAASGGQDFILDLVSPAGRALTVTAQFRNMETFSILRTITLPASTASRRTLNWDGRADNGAWVGPGMYEVTLKATDPLGGTATVKPIVAVRY
jgi:flagellar hook assembly protein FlgD